MAFSFSATAADSEPHMKTKLCNPAESLCTDVVSGAGGKNRATVDAEITASSIIPVAIVDGSPFISAKLRYADMNVANGGVARGTSIVCCASPETTVFSYSGTGKLIAFQINLGSLSSSSQNWRVILLIDGEEIFGSGGLNSQDLISSSVYDLNSAGAREPNTVGMEVVGSTLYITVANIYPVAFMSSVVIKVKKTVGSTGPFNAGLVLLTKET
jgi:hypothetical protein